jgi:uridine monophosphate synthetase
MRYEDRASLAQNAVTKACLDIMVAKQTNLSVAVDVATAEEMLKIADQVGPHVCVLKTHVDMFDQWDVAIAEKLQVRLRMRSSLLH